MTEFKPSLEVVVGAQFGSEAKGHVVQRLTERALHDLDGNVMVMRVAGPNAGHTGYDISGRPWPLRQIPVAAVVNSPRVILGIAPGSEIDPEVLLDEFDSLALAGMRPILWVSAAATLIDQVHKTDESNLQLTERIGSTGKGIGSARADRIMRSAKTVAEDLAFQVSCHIRGIMIAEHGYRPASMLTGDSDHMIIEGTQGFGLGLHTNYYPQVTSSDCRAADFMAMAGVHAWEFEDVEVWAVARIYPIRVAGNSGPLLNETSWEELGLPEERTTVTKKVRRVGGEDWQLVRRAVEANGGSPTVRLALTMLDQKFPSLRDQQVITDHRHPAANYGVVSYLEGIEKEVDARIGLITTGPNTATFV